jgi:A/G-specific adenine glycosylase
VPEIRPDSLSAMRRAILAWYAREHRTFPWRGIRDPYSVLVSEVMLQQTQANRVAERFPRFMARFPTIAALAAVSDAEVLSEWSGLGYNRRALALRRAARAIAASGWPTAPEHLEALPGVGKYTARALASLAFAQPVGVVDTNVRRWLVRRFGLDPTGPKARPVALQHLADALARAGLTHASPAHRGRGAREIASWTHATMELGASICRARNPACDRCPVAEGCPSRGIARRVPVPRQASFPGSTRAYRGAILRALARAPAHALRRRQLRQLLRSREAIGPDLDHRSLAQAITGLERDGLAHLDGNRMRLGSHPDPAPRTPVERTEATDPTATIAR